MSTASKSWADEAESEVADAFASSLKGLGDASSKPAGAAKSAAGGAGSTGAAASADGAADSAEAADSAAAAAAPAPRSSGFQETNADVVVEAGTDPAACQHVSVKSFEELDLQPDILKGVYDKKFAKPSKVQANALPIIVAGGNLIAQSQNGSGKTAAFALGMLRRVNRDLKKPQALCLAPTRELATQIRDETVDLGKYTNIKVGLCVPKERLDPGAQIVVGTPGMVKEFIKKRFLDTKHIRMFVLDEADHLIDMQGSGNDTKQIKKELPRDVQLLLFSATFTDRVAKFADEFAPGATKLMLRVEELPLSSIRQCFYYCKNDSDRLQFLSDIYGFLTLGQTVIFVNTRATADMLRDWMTEHKHAVSLLRGGEDVDPRTRDEIMRKFRAGETKVLICTDVLARGIDVPQISLVINFDMPTIKKGDTIYPNPETYLHRVGRTGRWDRKGFAVNFVHDAASEKILRAIEKHYGHEIRQIKDITELEQMLQEKW